jgi:Amt family ammonium transporter
LHGLCGTLGGILCGVFGLESFGGMGGVTFMAQLAGTLVGVVIALIAGFAIYGALKASVGIRLSEEEEFDGADLAIHKIGSTPDEDIRMR